MFKQENFLSIANIAKHRKCYFLWYKYHICDFPLLDYNVEMLL